MGVSFKLGCFSYLFCFLLFFNAGYSQNNNYDYKSSKEDFKTQGKVERFLNLGQVDSAKHYLKHYRNRLGYTYYRLKAITLAGEDEVLTKMYLDSAFRNGMSPNCLSKQKNLFDSSYVKESYAKNFLKGFDLALINSLDSMAKLDQLYRKQMVSSEDIKNRKQFKKPDEISETQKVVLEDQRKKQVRDSLADLQLAIDSTNQEFLFNIIRTKGWPTAKMIGSIYCHRSAPSPWLIIVHIKDLDKNRKMQTEVLKGIIPLCEKNEENWSAAEQYMWSIHNRSRKEFHEFSFITVRHDTLDKQASCFSAFQMAESVVKNSTERMEIKCKNFALFEQLRDYLIELGAEVNLKGLEQIYKMEGWPMPQHPTKRSFVYVPGPDMWESQVQFRFVQL